MPLGKPVPFAVNEVLYPVDKCMVGRGFVKIFGYPVIDRIVYIPVGEISTWVPAWDCNHAVLDIGFTVQPSLVQPYNVKMVVTLCAINNLPVV